MIAFSARHFIINICSVALLLGWQAAFDARMCSFNWSVTLFNSQMVKIFLSTDSNIISLRLAGGPCNLPGLERGDRVPTVSSFGGLPYFAVSL